MWLVKRVFPILSFINKHINHNKNVILIYNNLSFRDNNLAVYEYLIANGYNKKYKIIVTSTDYKEYLGNAPENVYFVGPLKSIAWFFKSKFVFYCIGQIPINYGKGQKTINMNHGMYIKNFSKGQLAQAAVAPKRCTYFMITGPVFFQTTKDNFPFPDERIVINGNPTADWTKGQNPHYDFGDYKKLIMWAPTFRKSESMNMNDVGDSDDELVPILKVDELKEVNDYLKSIGVKIVVKLHPEQRLDKYHLVDMDYLVILSHQEFTKRNMEINHFMAQCDGLITDYSSVYYNYLLLDRPIGFTEDDIQQYGSNRGFSMDPHKFRPGIKIHTKEDILRFAQNVLEGKDDYANERRKLAAVVNIPIKGAYTKRLLDFMGV